MASSFTAVSSDQFGDNSLPEATTRPFDDDGYQGYDPRLPSQRFDSFSNFIESESVVVSAVGAESPIYVSGGGLSPDPAKFSSFLPESNGMAFDRGHVTVDGPILPPLEEMEHEEGFALREWRRLNAIRLEEKEKREGELLSHIIEEAEDYKLDFYSRRKVSCETNKAANREKEKVFVASQENFHTEADKNYWKTISDLIPNEVPAIAKKRGKKDQEKQTSIVVVVQGPKPGKPTDLVRMRQILIKLKHNTPPHLNPSPPPVPTTKNAKTGGEGSAASAPPPKDVPVVTPVQTVTVV